MSRKIPLFGAFAFATWGAACTGDKDPVESAPPVETQPQETADDCVGTTAPVITNIELENTGIQRYENDDWPTLTVWVDVEDDDWDLATYALAVYYDDVVDGAVEATSSNGYGSTGTLSEDGDCTAPSGKVGLTLYLAGGGIEYDTLYEFGAVVTDDHHTDSEMVTTSGYTPTSTGEDGGP